MSSQPLFPNIRALDDPPQRQYTVVRGHRTPCYALAWKCRAHKYATRITEANMGLDVSNVGEEALVRWLNEYNFPRTQRPIIYVGNDGDFYLIAMFNGRHFPDFAARARDPDDPLIVAARRVLFVTDELQPTFKWYRFPMDWAEYNYDQDEDSEDWQ